MQDTTKKAALENRPSSDDILEKKAYIFEGLFLLANRLQALGDGLDDKITLKQWLFIASIIGSEQVSLAITELANYIGTSRQNAKKMATILEKKGFVALERDKSDARILRVSLTDKCTDYLAKRSKLENQFIERLFSEIDEEIINKTSIGISALLNNVIEMENEISQEKG